MLPDKKDRPPKTRFNSRDRSKETRATCVPRLKSFPAEKIKKLDDSPTFSPEPIGVAMVQRDPRVVFLASSSVGINCDRGDATSSELSHQQFKLPRASATNQQQVAPNHQQTDQTSPQSDSLQTRRTGSSERQARRPLAPNAYQEVVVHDRSPRNPSTVNQQMIVQHPPTRGTKRAFEPSASVERDCDEAVVLECEEQPVGGRNAASYRQAIMQMQRQQQDANNYQGVHLQDANEASSRHPFPESRQPICQQPQHDVYHQQMSQALDHAQSSISKQQQRNSSRTHCSYQNWRLSAAQLVSAQGMTSPQDMTISQMRLTRHNLPVHQQNLGCPVSQSAWPLDGRWTDHNQQHSCQQQQQQQVPSPHWGCCYQDMPDNSFSRQSPVEQDQRVPLRNQMSCEAVADQQAIKEAHARQNDSKRTLQFTPDMIRDQELLVSTMRQQGIPHDVMRRQFDALLHEQRRHLAYVAQFQQQTDASEIKRTCRLVQRRTKNDEKPEWMVHITPPRISYSDLESIKSQQRTPNEQHPTNDQPSQEVGRTVPVQLQQQDYRSQQPTEETIAPAVSPRRVYLQMNPHQWQQKAIDWSRRGDHRTPCGFMGCYPYGHQRSALNGFYCQPSINGFDQSQQGSHQCLYDASYYSANPIYSYQMHPEHQKAWLDERNATSPSQTGKRGVPTNAERSEKPTEPSSLLKMRVYKEVIRPQKRNNGLQDPETVRRALEALKDPTSKKGFEYLANLARRKPTIRLNGAQEADEIPEDLRAVSLENTSWAPKRVSANGLENNRNPNNPSLRVSRPRRLDEPAMIEYPRQRQRLKTCYGATAEMLANGQQRDHAAVVSHVRDAESIPCDRARTVNNGTITPPYGGAPDYQQMQRCCHSGQRLASHNGGQGDGIASTQRPNAPDATGIDRAGGDALGENSSAEGTTKRRSGEQSMPGTCSYGRPDIREARTIACAAAHLPARKPDYAPNNLAVSPDKLLASKLVRPPMIL
ncbi:uncharacterized protein LOC116846277 [Odontomachus brunneus]|uniref:uncharacterized protein LOC116846277 n=1 Tax=Odontomachus brunneus TaxID=486640 RepID=UPI0013F1F0C0|nr:uncharacterized protein LOC116846277 [Odontomachus brunneus]